MGRTVGTCVVCGEVKEIRAKGRCARCDMNYRREAEEEDLRGVLGAFAGRGHRRYLKEEDHLLESVTKIIKIVNREPGFSQEDTAAIKRMMKSYLMERAALLAPEVNKVNTKHESTVDLPAPSKVA